MNEEQPVVVYFDGVCNLCNASVDFIMRHNSDESICFSSLQSVSGQKVLEKLGLSTSELKTIIFEEDGALYIESDAALGIAARLDAPWRWIAVFRIFPPWLRNPIYRLISKNRYRWFGKKSSCRLPMDHEAKRFID